jgi:HipA-like protein
MENKELTVYIAGTQAGMLTQNSSGALSFQYFYDYRGAPLSSAMPLSTRIYHDKSFYDEDIPF